MNKQRSILRILVHNPELMSIMIMYTILYATVNVHKYPWLGGLSLATLARFLQQNRSLVPHHIIIFSSAFHSDQSEVAFALLHAPCIVFCILSDYFFTWSTLHWSTMCISNRPNHHVKSKHVLPLWIIDKSVQFSSQWNQHKFFDESCKCMQS